jgi:hypothetical protein
MSRIDYVDVIKDYIVLEIQWDICLKIFVVSRSNCPRKSFRFAPLFSEQLIEEITN